MITLLYNTLKKVVKTRAKNNFKPKRRLVSIIKILNSTRVFTNLIVYCIIITRFSKVGQILS